MFIHSPLKSVQMLPVFLSFLLCLIGCRAQQQFFHLVGPSSVFGFNNVNGAGNLMECKRFFENITDIETLNHHEYVAFESCVFYHLANKAQQQTAASGLNFGASLHPISSLPPNFSEIKLLVTKITIQHFQLNEFVRDLNIVGYLELRWNDDRLSWDQQQFKVPQIRIASASHIWVPYLTGQGFETALRNEFEQMEVRKLEVRSGGNVTAILGFKFSTFCDDTDFKNFPDDVYRCCYYLEPLNQRPLVRLLTDGLPVFTDPKYFRDYGWALSGTVPTIFMDPANITQMNFCLNLQRASSTLKTELEIPAWACAFLLLSTPLFAIIASVRTQLFAKLFILLLQFLTLMLFTQRIAPQMGSSATTPTILEVHELGLVLNVISILFSFLVLALCKLRVYNQPPWDILLIASSMINKFVCIFDSAADYQDLENLELKKEGIETGSDAAVSKSPSNRFRADWIGCFLAFHAVGTLVLSLCFLFGYLTIH